MPSIHIHLLNDRASRCRVGALILIAIGWALIAIPSTRAVADLIFNIPEVEVTGDGVNPTTGVFNVVLNLTGPDASSPPDVSSFNIDFNAVGPDSGRVILGPVSIPTAFPLFTGGLFSDSSLSDQNVRVAHDLFGDPPSSVVAFDGAALVTVQFEVDPGFFGTIPLELTLVPQLNELADAEALPLQPLILSDGRLTVVPEASVVVLWGAVVLVAICWRLRHRRHGIEGK